MTLVLETNLLKGIMVRMREEVIVGEDLGSRRVGPGVIGAKPQQPERGFDLPDGVGAVLAR